MRGQLGEGRGGGGNLVEIVELQALRGERKALCKGHQRAVFLLKKLLPLIVPILSQLIVPAAALVHLGHLRKRVRARPPARQVFSRNVCGEPLYFFVLVELCHGIGDWAGPCQAFATREGKLDPGLLSL